MGASGVPYAPRGGFAGRGRGGASPYGGISSRGGGVVGLGGGPPNPLLVPVKFVAATNSDFGKVGGEDDYKLDKAGAEAPAKQKQESWSAKPLEQEQEEQADQSADTELAEEVSRLGLAPPEPTLAELAAQPEHFEPEPESTATMALDEIEDAPQPITPSSHPGIGARRVLPPVASAPLVAAPSIPSSPPAPPAEPQAQDDFFPLFEISTAPSAVPAHLLATSAAPPAAFTLHGGEDIAEQDGSSGESSNSSSSDEDDQILYPPRARAVADPVSHTVSSLPPPVPIVPPVSSPSSPLAPSSKPPPTSSKLHGQTKKQLKSASRAARKSGRAHARTGNAHLTPSEPQTLGGLVEDEQKAAEAEADKRAGRELFARMNGGGGGTGVEDMLVASSGDEEDGDEEEEERVAAAQKGGHIDGAPRLNDSDVEWGSDGAPPPPSHRGPGGGRLGGGKSKRAIQRQQRADQREAEKLERLVAAGATREEVEMRVAMEVTLREEEEMVRQGKEERRRERKHREVERLQEDYLRNMDVGEEGDDSMAVMSAFAARMLGSNSASAGQERGDDLDRAAREDAEEDEGSEWGTSEESGSEDETSSSGGEEDSEEKEMDSEEMNAEQYMRRLARQEEETSGEELDTGDEIEVEYALGEADGRCVPSFFSITPRPFSFTDLYLRPAASSTPLPTTPTQTPNPTPPSPPPPTPPPKTPPSPLPSSQAKPSASPRWASPAVEGGKMSGRGRRRGGGRRRGRGRSCLWIKRAARGARVRMRMRRCLAVGRIRGRRRTRTLSLECRFVPVFPTSTSLPSR